ncbi:hypothetical protein ANAEL_00275 [Anaerolineales bacterium]|nr:hypothetical protein ANAEL_00275 [Anaerolineales bacterium]
MDVSPKENLPPPPGIINSIKAGFDLIATHITAILMPLFVNLFLWLGPRLRMDTLFNSLKPNLVSFWRVLGIPAEEIQQMVRGYETNLPDFNLFSLVSTFPVGVQNLFYSRVLRLIFPRLSETHFFHSTGQTPFGNPLVLQVDIWNFSSWVFWLILFGWILGGLYFRNIARLVVDSENDRPVRISQAILQTVLISIVWIIFSVMIGAPVLLVLGLMIQVNPMIALFVLVLLSFTSMWVILPLFFWPHGVFLKHQNAFTSILSSLQMTRFTLPTSSLFVLTVFLLSLGLNFLWIIPPEDSWMTLIGIFGHSFVATALLASSFVYYRDINAWLQSAIEYMKLNQLKRV